MKIYGMLKLTLLDFPGKTACTLFTGGCNLRCPFCHNASLVTELSGERPIDENEIFAFLKKRTGVLEGICISGGEPLLMPDISSFIKRVRELGYLIKLDTNGTFPETLKELVLDGLVDYVAMDIKNSPEKYAETVGLENFDITPVAQSVEFLLQNNVPYEFRTTIVKELHTPQDIVSIGKWITGAQGYFLQQFKDSGNLIGSGLSACGSEELNEMLQAVVPFVPNAEIRGI